ncbi:MAG TPA: beta-propeller fold lactonase family protein [Chloroflexia bacterium]|nr:beta-propeller fold lactonase family protein [Chloroflexia bacterium]
MLAVSKGRLGLLLFVLALLIFPLVTNSTSSAGAKGPEGAVYTLSNSAAGNSVLVFNRYEDGSLSPAGTVATGGKGLGAGLGSQGAVTLSKDNRWLFAVNAGDNSVSALKVRDDGLQLVDTVPSNGIRPISLTVHNDILYVLNAGGSGNISGFNLSEKGKLALIPGSSRPLSGNSVGAAQVSFSPNGKVLVVTEKVTNKIDTYSVDENGQATGPNVFNAAGVTPFGFAFDGNNRIIVSEAFGGAAGKSATSSYDVSANGDLQVVSASAPTYQTAACWIVVSKDGKYAYAANAGSSSVTGYKVAASSELTLVNADGLTGYTGPSTNPTDEAISKDGKFIYVLNSGATKIAAFQTLNNGHLAIIDGASGFPSGTVGLAAR